MSNKRIVEVYEVPEHWNRVCQATIPSCWTARFWACGREQRVDGDSREDVIKRVQGYFPGIRFEFR